MHLIFTLLGRPLLIGSIDDIDVDGTEQVDDPPTDADKEMISFDLGAAGLKLGAALFTADSPRAIVSTATTNGPKVSGWSCALADCYKRRPGQGNCAHTPPAVHSTA